MSGASHLIVGAGISGLAAAWELTRHVPPSSITVLEGTDRVGGKLRAGTVAGVTLDVGAESVLARRPEAVDLMHEVGLTEHVVHPATRGSAIWSRGALHPMPPRTLMGVPADPDALLGLLTGPEVDRVRREEPAAPGTEPDLSIGSLVAQRLGEAVTDRLLEPLLGGVYAGHARSISAAATMPVLWEAYRSGERLLDVAARALPAPDTTATPAPVFAGLTGGLHRLPAALAAALSERGVTIRTGCTVRELHRDPDGAGWELVTGPVPAPTAYRANRVLLALPPAPTARLLRDHCPGAAHLVGGIETASMAVVALAFRSAELPPLTGTGLLVPPVERRAVKAATFSANKWAWVAEAGVGAGPAGEDLVVLRTSLGRHREERALQRSDADLVTASLADLADFLGGPVPTPVDALVQRWGGGLPQYAVGHLDRVAAVRAEIAPVRGLEVTGAAYDGVGIPACIGAARAAARRLVDRP